MAVGQPLVPPSGWGPRHRSALVAGALLTYGWSGFFVTWLVRPDDTAAWAGNALFATVAIALVLWTSNRAGSTHEAVQDI